MNRRWQTRRTPAVVAVALLTLLALAGPAARGAEVPIAAAPTQNARERTRRLARALEQGTTPAAPAPR